jgi:hypothetical protein
MRRLATMAAWALVAFSFCCKESPQGPDYFYNPCDTTHPGFVAPRTYITEAPDSLRPVAVPYVTFQWRRNPVVGSYFVHFDSNPGSWTSDTSATFDFLDEGSHTFTIYSTNTGGCVVEKPAVVKTFTVDAVQGPSVMFFPRMKTVGVGETFTYDIRAEEVTNLFGAKLSVSYSASLVTVDSVQAGSYVQSSGGDAIVFSSLDNVGGKAVINLVIVGGNPKGITGSGVIATLMCRALVTGTADFSFDQGETTYRDTTNASIPIRDLVGGKVVVQ